MDRSVLNSGENLNLVAFNRADSVSHEYSKIDTSLEVLLGIPVSLQGGNIGLNFLLVESVVFGNIS